MKTRNTRIYHCLGCGNVVHRDPDAEPPECCGQEMVKAAATTVQNDDTPGSEPDEVSSKTFPSVVPKKARRVVVRDV